MASTLSMTFTPKILTRTGLIGATEAGGDESGDQFSCARIADQNSDFYLLRPFGPLH